MSTEKRIEVWNDGTVYCVSLCEGDGEEIKCLATRGDREEAEEAGRRAAGKRGIEVVYRDRHGGMTSLSLAPCRGQK